jgi:hypothetical protein
MNSDTPGNNGPMNGCGGAGQAREGWGARVGRRRRGWTGTPGLDGDARVGLGRQGSSTSVCSALADRTITRVSGGAAVISRGCQEALR